MNKAEPVNQFQEVYRQVKERLDRDAREKNLELQREKAEKEAKREGFDRA